MNRRCRYSLLKQLKNNGNKLQISKCLFRVLLSLAQMQNLGPIYKTKNVYSLMFMLVIIHRAYVLKLFLGILHLDRNHGCLQD